MARITDNDNVYRKFQRLRGVINFNLDLISDDSKLIHFKNNIEKELFDVDNSI